MKDPVVNALNEILLEISLPGDISSGRAANKIMERLRQPDMLSTLGDRFARKLAEIEDDQTPLSDNECEVIRFGFINAFTPEEEA